MAVWLAECWCEDHENVRDDLLWREKFSSLKKAQAACEEDAAKKMGKNRGMDQDWQLEGESYWNSCSNIGYIVWSEVE